MATSSSQAGRTGLVAAPTWASGLKNSCPTATAERGRSAGTRAKHFKTTTSKSSGMLSRTARIEGGDWVSFRAQAPCGADLPNGGSPASVSYIMQPRLYRSPWAAGLTPPESCSGLKYAGEPIALHRARWLCEQAQVSDAELELLATGRLPLRK